ncbi:TDP-N-acetylfucosamine:lipid II N-acetylfucosaminyltransferase [Pedobacter immunditicola]|uniref:TDP-N-acetylfucosamine:lipid II N-acetylfucosaminyltransferase n=1 Tax=Pedobacter immunditicola TaxID=3133440 RepID=UPI003094B2BC
MTTNTNETQRYTVKQPNKMQLKRVVNIMPDDKFLDYYIEMSERFMPDDSSYLIITDHEKPRFIKSQHPSLRVLAKSAANYELITANLMATRVVIFHSFKNTMHSFIQQIPARIKRVWLFWGFEGYSALPKTGLIDWHSNYAMYEPSLKGALSCLYNRFKGMLITRDNQISRDIIKQMDYCATWVDSDFRIAARINPGIEQLHFKYYTNELMHMDQLPVKPINLDRLLLGNSGDPTNNHIEALRYLDKINFKGEIICSLSYGGSKRYVERVIELGKKLFGSRFIPLKTFMPLNEYQETINSCGLIWMNHKRQQAAGNLLVSFLSNKIIILDDDNPLKHTFKNWGLIFFYKEILKSLGEIPIDNLVENRNIVLNKVGIQHNAHFFKVIHNL